MHKNLTKINYFVLFIYYILCTTCVVSFQQYNVRNKIIFIAKTKIEDFEKKMQCDKINKYILIYIVPCNRGCPPWNIKLYTYYNCAENRSHSILQKDSTPELRISLNRSFEIVSWPWRGLKVKWSENQRNLHTEDD